MSQVFVASLLPNSEGSEGSDAGSVSVKVRNLPGEELCNFEMQGETLQDLKRELSDPHGPMSKRLRTSSLNFYTVADPSKQLDLQLHVRTLSSELVIKQADVEDWLERFPDVGKFLEAMRDNKFDPESANFDVTWTARKAKKVPLREAVCLVQEALNGLPTHADSESQFVQTFGKLTAGAESWNMLHLGMLQTFDGGMRRLKHFAFEHWLDLARTVATSMVSQDPSPVVLLLRLERGTIAGLNDLGTAFPRNFPQNLQNHLTVCDARPRLCWTGVFRPLLSFDWDIPREGIESFRTALAAAEQDEPAEFGALQPHEICRMVHVQLRLSSVGVAEVEGPINEVSVKILAQLLRYKLKILPFQSETELQDHMACLECGQDHRRTLMLIKGVPASRQGTFFRRCFQLVPGSRATRGDRAGSKHALNELFARAERGLVAESLVDALLQMAGWLVEEEDLEDCCTIRLASGDRLSESISLSKFRAKVSGRRQSLQVQASKTLEDAGESISFEQFLQWVDDNRAVKANEQRRCAGFSSTELDSFRMKFTELDSQGSGVLDIKHLGPLLERLGLPALATAEERNLLLADLEKARETASTLGVVDVGEKGEGFNFWVLVQLLRIQFSRDDVKVLDRESQAVSETMFSQGEVDGFRESFVSWFERQGRRMSAGNEAAEQDQSDKRIKELHKDTLVSLIRSLGCKIDDDQRKRLDRKIEELNPNSNLDFPDFLRLMRWIVTVDFGGIESLPFPLTHRLALTKAESESRQALLSLLNPETLEAQSNRSNRSANIGFTRALNFCDWSSAHANEVSDGICEPGAPSLLFSAGILCSVLQLSRSVSFSVERLGKAHDFRELTAGRQDRRQGAVTIDGHDRRIAEHADVKEKTEVLHQELRRERLRADSSEKCGRYRMCFSREKVTVTKEFETLFENSIAGACGVEPSRVAVLRTCQETGEVDFTIQPDAKGSAHAAIEELRSQLADDSSALWNGTLSKFASHIDRFSAILPSPHCLWTPEQKVLQEPSISQKVFEDLQDLEGIPEHPESSDDEVDVRKRPEYWGVRVRELAQFHQSIREELAAYCADHMMRFGANGCVHLCKKGSCKWGDHSGIQHQKLEDKSNASELLPNMHAVHGSV
eukprot:s1441_g5.t1